MSTATAKRNAGPFGALAALAKRIGEAHEASKGNLNGATRHAIRAGKLLAEAKELVPHGEFGGWLDRNFSGSRRTAQLYLRLARDAKSAMSVALSIRGEEATNRDKAKRTPATDTISAISRANRAIERLTGDGIYQPTDEEIAGLRDCAVLLRTLAERAEAYSIAKR